MVDVGLYDPTDFNQSQGHFYPNLTKTQTTEGEAEIYIQTVHAYI